MSLFLFSSFLLILSFSAFAQGSMETALTLAPNGSATNSLSDSQTELWYKVTTPSDGKLVITVDTAAPLDADMQLYDENINVISVFSASGQQEVGTRENLGAGIYYYKVFHFGGAQGSFTISSVFTAISLENDSEPNQDSDSALTLALDGSDTGHMGYFTAGPGNDTVDWYKITIPSDGKLTVTFEMSEALDMDVRLYDENISVISSFGATGTLEECVRENLGAGTYYYESYQFGSGHGSYTVSTEFTAAKYDNDEEPNNDVASATTIETGTTFFGHMGYFMPGAGDDTSDYFAFAVPSGWDSLFVKVLSDSTFDTDFALYRADETYVGQATATDKYKEYFSYANPEAGSYVANIYRYGSGQGSYMFIVSNSSAALPQVPVVSGTGYIYGYVIDQQTGLTVPDATVTLMPGGDTTTSDEDGFYLLTVPSGSGYSITAEASGLYPNTVSGISLDVDQDLVLHLAISSLITDVEDNPLAFNVSAAFPNPFNPATTIEYTIPQESHVRFIVYDILGREVRTLQDGTLSPGSYRAVWDGRDSSGSLVGNGIYLYRVSAGKHVMQGKLTFLR